MKLLIALFIFPVSVCLAEGEVATDTLLEPVVEDTPTVGLGLQYGLADFSRYLLDNASAPGRAQRMGLEVEYMLYQGAGEVSVGAQTALIVAANTPLGNNVYASLTALPIAAYLAYRLDVFQDQWFVPFARVGPEVMFAWQTSETGAPQRESSGAGWMFGAGFELLLDSLDQKSAGGLNRDVGINNTYLVVEYQQGQQSLSNGLNAGRESLHLSLRFEI